MTRLRPEYGGDSSSRSGASQCAHPFRNAMRLDRASPELPGLM